LQLIIIIIILLLLLEMNVSRSCCGLQPDISGRKTVSALLECENF